MLIAENISPRTQRDLSRQVILKETMLIGETILPMQHDLSRQAIIKATIIIEAKI